MAKKVDSRTFAKLTKIQKLIDEIEPAPRLVEEVLAVLIKYSQQGKNKADQLELVSAKIAQAMECFAQAQCPTVGDVRLGSGVEHEARMQDARKLTELLRQAQELLDTSTSLRGMSMPRDEIKTAYRHIEFVVKALNNNNAARAADWNNVSEPRATRYMLYAVVMGGWYRCKGVDRIPTRTMNNEREPEGEFFDYLADVFNLTPDGRTISVDEAHKAMLSMEKNEVAAMERQDARLAEGAKLLTL